MKKALFILVGILAVGFFIANIDFLKNFAATVVTGSLVPIILSIIFMLGRYIVQALSYDAAFEAVGHKTGLWHNIVLIFSLVFINTFCLFSGATGLAFIIDDAHREGCDAGQATGGAILSQIGFFAAILVISVIGFVTMFIGGHTNTIFIIGGVLLALVLAALSSLFFIGHLRPKVLYRLFYVIQKIGNKVLNLIKRPLKPAWWRKMAHQFISTSNILYKNPKGTWITVGYASLSAILNMATLVAIGYAFGFENVGSLVAAFAAAAITVQIAPTPQGIGVVEAVIIAITGMYGCPIGTATAIALVYRGILFWIPFGIGAVMLSQSGFFKSNKSASQLKKDKDTAWVFATLVFIIGAVNIVLTYFPSVFTPFTMMTEWVDISTLFVGLPLTLSSLLMIVCAFGLVQRYRTAWALCTVLMMLIGGCEFLFEGSVLVGIVTIGLTAALFYKRDVFDQPIRIIDTNAVSWQESAESGAKIQAEAMRNSKADKSENNDNPVVSDFDKVE